MAMTDDEVQAKILGLINENVSIGHIDVLRFYGDLAIERGKNCADHFLTIIQFSLRGATPKEKTDSISVLVRSHPDLKSIKRKVATTLFIGIVMGAGATSIFLNNPLLRIFASTGIIGVVLLTTILLFREPLGKVLFSRLNSAQTERVITAIIWVSAAVVIIGVLGAVAVAIIQAARIPAG